MTHTRRSERQNKWEVFLYGIEWDDSKGYYDTSELPKNLKITVYLEPEYGAEDAMEEALEDATDEYGFLIEGTQQILASCCK